MIRFIIFLFLIILMPTAVLAKDTQKYTCPMHPHYIADTPGTCPICGMDLVPVASAGGSRDTAETEAGTHAKPKSRGKKKILYYKHPMGQPDTSPVPKKDSMGMDYIPVYEDETIGTADVVTISPEMVQNIGVRTAPAEMTVFGRTVRAFGAVTENTRLQSVVASRVEGWIEELTVTAVGDAVKKGDLLFRLYSPDLIAAQQDYLSALARGSVGRGASSARRLHSLGVQEQTVEALRTSRKAFDRVPIFSERDGIVARLNVREGTYVKPGDTIAVIQDYSSVWVTAAVAEKDLAMLDTGRPARLQFVSLPGKEVAGTVDYIHPTVDPQSRTGQVRLVLNNPEGALRPGAYADVVFDVDRHERLAVPSEAVLRDSQGAYVIAALGNGRFRPRRVRLGVVSEGRTEVLSSLRVGEEIVISGQFLIDSESALREALHKLDGTQVSLAALRLTPTELSLVDHFVDAALYIHETLTTDETLAPGNLDAALTAGERLKPRFGGTSLGPVLENSAAALRAAQKARTERELEIALSNLVTALKPWLLDGRPVHYRKKGLRLTADNATGDLWLQLDGKLLNPYNGKTHGIPWPEETNARSGALEKAKTPKQTGAGHEHR